jgi:hypothetical protein
MKTIPPGKLKVAAVVGLGVATILGWRALAQSPAPTPDRTDERWTLKIHTHSGKYHELKMNDCTAEDEFINLLNGPNYLQSTPKLHFQRGGSSHVECDLPGQCGPCSGSPSPGNANIKTDKVIVARTAHSVVDGDPHTTQQVVCKTIADVKAVLDKLADP